MNQFCEEVRTYLANGDKECCVSACLTKLERGELTVVQLYTEVLGPALDGLTCEGAPEVCIWKEHRASAIVRAVVESAFPYVLKASKPPNGKKALVVCPPDELHEIGPRMVADFFALCGCRVVFVGANTPRESVLSAVEVEKPDYLAVSVTNFYNLVATRELIAHAKARHPVKVVVGGKAFRRNPEKAREFGADALLQTFEDVERLVEGRL